MPAASPLDRPDFGSQKQQQNSFVNQLFLSNGIDSIN